MVTPMTPWFHVGHVLLMPATCDCAWLLMMPIVATMRGHRSLVLLDRSHHDPLEPCAPGEFRVFESVGCLQLFAFCLPCNSQCACGGMTTAETTFPPLNLSSAGAVAEEAIRSQMNFLRGLNLLGL